MFCFKCHAGGAGGLRPTQDQGVMCVAQLLPFTVSEGQILGHSGLLLVSCIYEVHDKTRI
jgi:hypothetical protein